MHIYWINRSDALADILTIRRLPEAVQSALREMLEHGAALRFTTEEAFRRWVHSVAMHKIVSKSRFHAAGKREAFIAQYDPGQKDFTALIARLRDARVGVVLVGGYPAEIGLLARQLRAALPGTVLIGGDSLVTGEFAEVAGGEGHRTGRRRRGRPLAPA